MRSRIRMALVLGLAAALVFVATWRLAVYAGYFPPTLDVELDMAERIVVGKVTKMEVPAGQKEKDSLIGLATITIEETVKGPTAATVVIETPLPRADGNDYEEQFKRQFGGVPICKMGDDGIWVIMKDGQPSIGWPRLNKNRLKEVKEVLAELSARRWSEPVNGIAVWAGTSQRHPHNKGTYVLFAVRNAGTETIHVPRPNCQNIFSFVANTVSLVARHEDGKEYVLTESKREDRAGERPASVPLAAGQSDYLACMPFPKNMPPGTYSIRGAFSNDRAQGRVRGDHFVQLWRGEAAAPTVTVTIEAASSPTVK